MYTIGLIKYVIAWFVIIALGLISRQVNQIPPLIGDILYAVMVYLMFRILLLSKALKNAFYATIIFCFVIEFLQLVQWAPLIWIRQHPLLRLVFGQGFLCSDLLAYLIGGLIAYYMDIRFLYNLGRRK